MTDNLGIYLRVASIHDRLNMGLYQQILDRIGTLLEGWKTKHISLAERHTLAQSVLTSIPLYHMQSSIFPMGFFFLIGNKKQYIREKKKPNSQPWSVYR